MRWYTKDNTTLAATNRNATDQVTDNTVSDDTPAGEQPDPSSTTTDLNDAATGDAVVIENASAMSRPAHSPASCLRPKPMRQLTTPIYPRRPIQPLPWERPEQPPTLARLPIRRLPPIRAVGEQSTPAEAALDLPSACSLLDRCCNMKSQPQFSDAAEILTEAPVTAEDLGLTTSVDSVEMPPIDLAAQSEVIVPALVIGDLPLSHFVCLWSNLSGIPTGINLASLAAAGIDCDGTLSLAMVQSATFGSLVELSAPLGLQAVWRDNRFWSWSLPTWRWRKSLVVCWLMRKRG